jgi:L-2,4-diaminobutyrate decarboxylase
MSFSEDVQLVAAELERYRCESLSGALPVVHQAPIAEVIETLGLKHHVENGALTGKAFAEFVRRYLDLTVRLYHPGSLAHQVAVPHPAAALAMLVEGVTNNPASIYEMGPAATGIEAFLVEWLVSKVGWTGRAGGVFTHGGSLANLTALVAARSHFDGTTWTEGCRGDLAVVASADCHYSIARAAGILGIGEKSVYALAVASSGGVVLADIRNVIERARADGKRPFVLVANACSTATGAFDPLREIAAICRDYGLWLHVDGAHGASALLSQRHRWRLDGIELADSLIWDAHKLLCTPGPCTAILVRDAATLDTAFHQDASYLFHSKQQPGFDLVHRTVECTKAALGLRLFAVVAALGERGLADYVDKLFELTHQAYELLRRMSGLECAVEPQSNILCFRVDGADEEQLRVRDGLLAAGDFHLSTAVVGQRRYLRVVMTNPAATLDDIQRLAARVLHHRVAAG